MSNKNSKIQI